MEKQSFTKELAEMLRLLFLVLINMWLGMTVLGTLRGTEPYVARHSISPENKKV